MVYAERNALTGNSPAMVSRDLRTQIPIAGEHLVSQVEGTPRMGAAIADMNS